MIDPYDLADDDAGCAALNVAALEQERLTRGPVRGPTPKPLAERLLSRRVVDDNGCWIWQGSINHKGYGYIKVGSRRTGSMRHAKVHRLAYELWVDLIPKGMQIDHKCRHRSCFNPAHLRLATNKQNGENRSIYFPGSKSGLRGVVWDAKRNLWRARVLHNRKWHNAGWYSDVAEAGRAIINLRRELYTHNDEDWSAWTN